MPTLLRDLIEIPEFVSKGDFVLKLTEGTDPSRIQHTLKNYVVTPELTSCFGDALKMVKTAVEGRTSKAAYLEGSFGAGKSHFMAVLHLLLAGNPEARSIPELGNEIGRHAAWMEGKKFLMVPFHFLAADSLESALFKGYTDLVLKQFPDKPYPALVTSTALLQNAAQSRASMGDAKFFEILNRGAAGAGKNDGWGELGSGWDADTFERAASKTPADSERIRLVGDLIETHFPAMRNTSDYLSIDDGLAVMSQHAKDLGYDAVILFLDELILWLASHAADVNFVSREAQKLPKLVEAQNLQRPAPLVSFIARQRDLRDLVGQHIAGAEKLGFVDVLQYSEGRFEHIKLEDRNLPAIAEKRILRPKSGAAKLEIDAAFSSTAQVREEVMKVLLTTKGRKEEFRQLYPFSPALVETLVAVSSLLQRERTAIKVMVQLLAKQRDTLALGTIIPVGDLFDEIAEGDDAFSVAMKTHCDKTKKLYSQQLRPLLERTNGLTFEEAAALPSGDPKAMALRTDDRLIKTLLLAAWAPEVESLKHMTPQRLAALNHGTIKAFIPGQEAQQVLRKCKEWAAQVGELQVQESGGTHLISIRITGVDLTPILERAESVDNYGNRVARIKMLIFEVLGLSEQTELRLRHSFRWRGTDREAEIQFANVREASDEMLESSGDTWRVVIDYPFDRDGHNANEDVEHLERFRANRDFQNTICWLPSFLNYEAQKAVGELVRLEHILTETRFPTFVDHLSEQDRAQARPLLENLKSQKRAQLASQLEAAYGIRSGAAPYIDPANSLEGAEHFKTLCDLTVQPPAASNLKEALNKLLEQALEFQFAAHPVFEEETRLNKTSAAKVLEVFSEAVSTDQPSFEVKDFNVRKLTRLIANPLKIGQMSEMRFAKAEHWKQHFSQQLAKEGGGPIHVERLRKWLDVPKPMGLPTLAEDLVICCWALQTGHAFYKGEVAVPAPAPGDLKEDMLLRPVALPEETAWKQALERSKGLFGVNSPTALLNVGNVSEVCRLLREKVEKWLPASSILEAELDKTAPKLGLPPRQSQRAKTNQEALELLKAMKGAAGDIALITVLAAHSLTSKSNPLSLAMSKADGVAEAMRRIPWPLVDALVSITDGRNAAAQTILGALREGFERDEHALAFAPKVEDFTKDAASLLALAQVYETPARPVEVPPIAAAIPQAASVPVVLSKPASVTPRNKRSQAKGDSVAAWVPQDFANYTLVEVTVQTVDGASQALVLTANTARLIEQSGDAVYDPKAKLLRFEKWNFSVEIDPEGAA
jgi:hypothetical protein